VNWLDPEPDRESSDYGKYIKKLRKIESQIEFYRGFHQPPTEEQYHELWERFQTEGEWWEDHADESEEEEEEEESDNESYDSES
jgi:hypothetical protein